MSEDKTKQIITLHKYKTEFNADSVEWCPHKPYQHFFVCANYQLTETQERIGRILLFSITPANELQLCQTVNTSAVLDQKWCLHCPILTVVNAASAIEVYKFENERLMLITTCTVPCEALILSVDWTKEHEMICSDSKGNWHKLELCENNLVLQNTAKAHDFEAWIAAFYSWNTAVFYTGGDDALLLTFDTRIGTAPVNKNRVHQAGVTSVHSNINKEFQIATGSYDENVRLWDVRNMKVEECLTKMPGPVWRLKWDPFNSKSLLSACMLGGAHVLGDGLDIVCSFYEHESMVYGVDWCHLGGDDRIIGTCSFYDSLLCISKLPKENKEENL